MKHLVTGGTGFLGNLIVRRFHANGQRVTSLDVWQEDVLPQGIEFVKGSVLDRELVRRLMKDVDMVHHTAALVPLTKAGKEFQNVNVEGSRIVAEEAAAAGVKTFIHISSSAVFGAPPCPASNDSPLRPLETYGRSKLEGEKAVQAIAANSDMKLVIVRPRTLVDKERLGIFQILFEWIKDSVDIYVIGSGHNKIQFLNASDLISAYMLICEAGRAGQYNVGTDRYGTLRQDLEALCRHAGTRSRVRSLPYSLTVGTLQALDLVGLSPLAPWHYLTYGKDFYFDIKELTDLGWKPRYSNLEMLVESYDSFVADYDRLMAMKGGSAHRKKVVQGILGLIKQFSKH